MFTRSKITNKGQWSCGVNWYMWNLTLLILEDPLGPCDPHKCGIKFGCQFASSTNRNGRRHYSPGTAMYNVFSSLLVAPLVSLLDSCNQWYQAILFINLASHPVQVHNAGIWLIKKKMKLIISSFIKWW